MGGVGATSKDEDGTATRAREFLGARRRRVFNPTRGVPLSPKRVCRVSDQKMGPKRFPSEPPSLSISISPNKRSAQRIINPQRAESANRINGYFGTLTRLWLFPRNQVA